MGDRHSNSQVTEQRGIGEDVGHGGVTAGNWGDTRIRDDVCHVVWCEVRGVIVTPTIYVTR